tara:strand:+ start:459 stop:1106 length:648 start_codon:yes stop_codon:yes gene_type:complete
LEKDYRKNLLKRFFTSLVIFFPIAIIIYIESILLFSVLIILVCVGGFIEWIKNRLGNNFLGIFIISSFGISSIIFVDTFAEDFISAYLVFLLAILNTAIFDTFAYIVGSNFGRTKIAKKISPNKTYEGLIAGIISSVIYGYLVCIFLNLDLLIILCFVIGCLFAFLGDLLISYFKRRSGIKDTGSLLPGHGGLLDRLDSHLLATPLLLGLISLVL